jgi:hypothetical protein
LDKDTEKKKRIKNNRIAAKTCCKGSKMTVENEKKSLERSISEICVIGCGCPEREKLRHIYNEKIMNQGAMIPASFKVLTSLPLKDSDSIREMIVSDMI